MDAIVGGLFPTHASRERWNWQDDEPIEPITVTEIKDLAKNILTNKAPGPDGIPEEAVKLLSKAKPDWVAKTFNKCL